MKDAPQYTLQTRRLYADQSTRWRAAYRGDLQAVIRRYVKSLTTTTVLGHTHGKIYVTAFRIIAPNGGRRDPATIPPCDRATRIRPLPF